MGSIRIPKDELMSYTVGTLNAILRHIETDGSDSVEEPDKVVSTQAIMGLEQSKYLDSLTPEQLKELKEKHGVR